MTQEVDEMDNSISTTTSQTLNLMDLPNKLLNNDSRIHSSQCPLSFPALVSYRFSNLVGKIIYDSIYLPIDCPDEEHMEDFAVE